jgi:hypothetical protein
MFNSHTRAEEAFADDASKPLEGKDFKKYCKVVQGMVQTTR